MGILYRIHQFIFKDKDKPEDSDFDLKALKENLRKNKEIEFKKSPNYQRNNKESLIIDEGNFEIIREIKWLPDWTAYARGQRSDDELLIKTLELRNPLLLGVKMFLADVIYMVNMPYDYERHNCANFAKEVQNAATKRGIRCGLVTIIFHRSQIGHAIVAFETDYGLKFFEPQSASEEDVIVGGRYSASLSEISNDDIIIKIEISWNDGTRTTIE